MTGKEGRGVVSVIRSEYRVSEAHGKYRLFHFCGLDAEKPAGSYEGVAVANGSVYYGIDTGAAYCYDEAGREWHPQAAGGTGLPL